MGEGRNTVGNERKDSGRSIVLSGVNLDNELTPSANQLFLSLTKGNKMPLQSNLNIVAQSVDVTGRNSTYFHL